MPIRKHFGNLIISCLARPRASRHYGGMIRRYAIIMALTTLVGGMGQVALAAENGMGLHALSMHGTPKLPIGFPAFDYVNPDAPKGGELRLGMTGSFDNLNPFIVRGQPPLGLSTGYLSLVYQPLMMRSWDEPFTLYPLLAESVDVPADRASITFHLDRKARWSDGIVVTADDILFSYQTLRDKGRPNHRTYYKKVAKAEKLDERSVRFVFKTLPDGTIDREMPMIMALMPMLPRHVWMGREFNATTWQKPVGTGPYRVVQVEPGRSIVYERITDYWGAHIPSLRGLYNFDRVRLDYYRDDGVAIEALKAGQIDWRREQDIHKWATAYDSPAISDGRLKLQDFLHNRTESMRGFVLNMRRFPFQDMAVRQAVAYAFDAGWINTNLYHGLLQRTESFFPNSYLASPLVPDAGEQAVLNRYAKYVPAGFEKEDVRPPASDGREESLRNNLVKAAAILSGAGYVLRDGKLYSSQGKAVAFTVLLNDPADEKVALSWVRNLKRLGIIGTVQTVDSAHYQQRIAQFDYDVMLGQWTNSLSPGNEQAAYWGSNAADQPGSRNYPGIKNKLIDALVAAVPAAATRDELVAITHALDRALLEQRAVIPFFYNNRDHVAYWQQNLRHPDGVPLYGVVLESWWQDRKSVINSNAMIRNPN